MSQGWVPSAWTSRAARDLVLTSVRLPTDYPTVRNVLHADAGDTMPESTGSNGMTLQDYLKIFRHRWLVIAACTLTAAAVMWFVTPASTDTTLKVGSYTATATLLVGSNDPGET